MHKNIRLSYSSFQLSLQIIPRHWMSDAEAIDEFVRAGGVDFDKPDFLSIFQHMRD